MNNELSKTTIDGLIWKFAERFALGCFTIVISTILARILSPEDYAVVGIVTIVYSLADVLISNGLSTALIRTTNLDNDDIKTALLSNIVISFLLYVVLFLVSPLIAIIYKKESVVYLIRVLGLLLIINSIKSVICAYITNKMDFKKFFFATIGGTIISGSISIIMALNGFGPWAIVAQQMINSIVDTIILFFITKINFHGKFSMTKLKELFSFGWRIFVSEFIDAIYNECNPLIIGIRYNTIDLSYYSKGKLYPYYINNLVSNTLVAVLFPAMSKLQNDIAKLKEYTKKFVIMSSYVLFPLLFGFAAISDNFIKAILTEKWMPASIYIKIFCVSYIFTMLTKGNLQVIKALGRSDIYLKNDIIKKAIYLVLTIAFVFYTDTPEKFAIVNIVISIIAVLINSYPTKKLINYGILEQIQDMIPNIIISTIMFIIVYYIGKLNIGAFFLLIIQIVIGIIVYLLLSVLVKIKGYVYLVKTIKKLHKN